MPTIAGEIYDLAVSLGYEGKRPAVIGQAVDALADTLAGYDVPDAQTAAQAIAELRGHIAATPSGTVSIAENGAEVDVSSYAKATVAVPAYVVSFDANGGTGTVAPMACAKGSTLVLPDGTGFTPPSEKQFAGWGTTSDATDTITTYAATAASTLYAVYEVV